MPVFTTQLRKVEGMTPNEGIKSIANHIRRLQEELEYRLTVLDSTNINEIDATKTNIITAEGNLLSVIKDGNDKISTLSQTVDGLGMKVESYEETVDGYLAQVSSFEQTVEGFSATVMRYEETVDGYTEQVSAFEQSVDGFATTVKEYEVDLEGYREQVSTFEQTVDGFNTTVQNYETDLGGYKEQVSSFEQSVEGFRTTVQSYETSVNGYAQQVSTFEQTASSFEATVQDLETGMGTMLRMDANGLYIVDGNGKTVTIDGGQIDAENLVLTGCIRFSDLTSSLQDDINDAYVMAEDAESAVSEITYTYNGKTYIDEDRIMAGSVIAGSLMGGEVGLLTAAEDQAGGLDITGSSSSSYAIELWSNGALRLVAEDGDLYMEAGGEYITIGYVKGEGYPIVVSNTLMPATDGDINLGNYTYYWANAYIDTCYGYTEAATTSDRNKKHDISYDLDRYDPFFDGLKPAVFRLNNGTSGRLHPGLVAQDVEEDLAQSNIPTSDFAGFIKMEDSYALRYGEFIALLIWQVQKLKSRVAKLEDMIA